jgi:hypothetical protein
LNYIPKITEGEWVFTSFCKQDGSPIASSQDVADTISVSALKCDAAELWGVSTPDNRVICYTGNGPDSKENARAISVVPRMMAEIDRLNKWVSDCQAGMYVNCVYCGHRYGPDKDTPVAMADVLKQHIAVCPKHPMSELLAICKEIPEHLDAPERNCSCHISPPCEDCIQYEGIREFLERAKSAVRKVSPVEPTSTEV